MYISFIEWTLIDQFQLMKKNKLYKEYNLENDEHQQEQQSGKSQEHYTAPKVIRTRGIKTKSTSTTNSSLLEIEVSQLKKKFDAMTTSLADSDI